MFIRILVLVLACMTVAAGGWLVWRGPAEPASSVPPAPAGPPPPALVRVEEAPPAAPRTADPVPVPTVRDCLRLGPFASAEARDTAAAALEGRVEGLHAFETRDAEVERYRVLLPAAASREAALAQARELARLGVRDYYVITEGPEQNAIALGLFGRHDNALRRQRELAELGLEATVEPRRETRLQWWLEWVGPRDLEVSAALRGTEAIPAATLPCIGTTQGGGPPLR